MNQQSKVFNPDKMRIEQRCCVICGNYFFRRSKRGGVKGSWKVRPHHAIACSRACSKELIRQYRTNLKKKNRLLTKLKKEIK